MYAMNYFASLGIFYASGMQDTEVTKSLKKEMSAHKLFCIIICHFYKFWIFLGTLQIIFANFLAMPDTSTLDKPGAAHMSKIISPGQGPNTCPTTTEGKFWRNSKFGRTPLREGQLYRGNLTWIATPLQTKKYGSSRHMQYSLLLYVQTYLNNEIKIKSERVFPII